MGSFALLALYSSGVITAAVVGGAIPLWERQNARRIEAFFAASAGLMLGVLGGHMLPEAFDAGPRGGWAIVAGFLFMLVVERFVLPHALHAPQASEAHEHCDPSVEAEHVRADAAGVGAFLGLALHTLSDGLALGASIDEPKVAPFVFAAIVTHKIPTAFALSSILVRARMRTSRALLASATLGAMVAIGGALYLLLRMAGGITPGRYTPYAVGFSAGSFLHVAVTDLLPDLHRHGRDQRRIVIALIGGIVAAVLLSALIRD